MRALALGLLALLPAAPQALAAAWTQAEGSGIFIGTAAFTAGSQYLRAGNPTSQPEYRKLETTFYLEYGVTDWLTAIAAPSLRWTRSAGAGADSFSGLGYTDLGARVRLWSDSASVLSIQAVGRIPGASDDRRSARAGNTDAQFDLRLLYGHGFQLGETPAFVNAEAAYRFRADDPPDEWRLDLTFGIRPAERWLLLAQSFTTISNGAGRGVYPASWNSKAQLSAVYEFAPGWSLQGGVIFTTAGDDALRELGGLIGVWRRF